MKKGFLNVLLACVMSLTFVFSTGCAVIEKLFSGDGVEEEPQINVELPEKIFLGAHNKNNHCQGFALDTERKYAYQAYAHKLVKTDLEGNVIGTVENITGHLGCIDYCDEDGKLYGALSQVVDESSQKELGFIAIFDVSKIDQMGMNAEKEEIMRVVRLKTVEEYTSGTSISNGVEYLHKYGSSGIDGLTIGPDFGAGKDSKKYLQVSMGILGDTEREDNDHQIILQYEFDSWWSNKATRFSQDSLSEIYTENEPRNTYFIYTGNTTWGIQNFEYDEYTGDYFAFFYRGEKPEFPNYDVFFIDGSKKAELKPLEGKDISGLELSLRRAGKNKIGETGIYFSSGSMGAYSLGDGRFYFVETDNSGANGTELNAIMYKLKEGKTVWSFEKQK